MASLTLAKATSPLREILSYFPTQSTYVFAYGPSIIPRNDQIQPKMADLIFVVDNPITWHQRNLVLNPNHYSFLKYCGGKAISKVQDLACGVYYHPFANVGDKLVKYGVISTSTLNNDLQKWTHMYIAGRLQKPVLDLKSPTCPELEANLTKNHMAALRAVLLQLPPVATKYELYYGITSLSYIGDFRIYIEEDPRKIKNIVLPLMADFDQIYLPLLDSLKPIVTMNKDKTKIFQKNSPDTHLGHLLALPMTVQIHLAHRFKYNMARFEVEEVMISLSRIRHIDLYVLQSISSIVTSSSFSQTCKGILTAGPFKSIWYGVDKVLKKLSSGSSLNNPD